MTRAPQDVRDLAADHVLGLLSPAAMREVEAAAEADPALAAQIAELCDLLLPLDLSASPQPLPPGFAERMRAVIAATPQEASAPAPAPANLSHAPRRRLAGLAAALVLGLALGFGGALQRPAPAPQVVAVLLDDLGRPRAVIDDYGDQRAQIRFVSEVEIPEGFAIQAWTLPSAQMGPRSLGVLERARATPLSGPDLPAPGDAQLYEITLEPAGGSPTGRPTGPIIAKGLAVAQGI